jgi:hypothetical protein
MPKFNAVYKGELCNADSVKKKVVFQGVEIHLDRPKGLVMTGEDKEGKPWTREYLYDYGFIPKTLGGDGDGLDVFIGPHKDATETYWATQNKDDGSFDEYKVFMGFSSRAAAEAAFREHIPLKFLGSMVSMRLDMMKAMLGMNPTGLFKGPAADAVKTASARAALQAVSFTHHRNRLLGWS